jgi:hypothetical protein
MDLLDDEEGRIIRSDSQDARRDEMVGRQNPISLATFEARVSAKLIPVWHLEWVAGPSNHFDHLPGKQGL